MRFQTPENFLPKYQKLLLMNQQNQEVQKFVSCALDVFGDPSMLLICGSTANGEMTELSDVDGNAFVDTRDEDKLSRLKENFERLAEEKYGKTTEGGFYEPHWSLFVLPKETIYRKEIFSRHVNGLPTDFTMFNLKHNTSIVYGEDLRGEIPVQFSPNLIDGWASFAPNYHLRRAEELLKEKKCRKACYALSRSILQGSRVVVWKEAECISSSYEKIVGVVKDFSESTLLEWALEKRNKDFESTPEELGKRLERARGFLRTVIERYVL